MVYGNRLNLNSKPGRPCPFLRPADAELYMRSAHIVRFIQTAVHELLGHGTGKLLVETNSGSFNFDHDNPPVSPVTGKPIESWYKPGQTWNTVFGKLAPTVEECRAFLVADYLSDNKDILAMFGYNESSTPTANDRKRPTSSLSLAHINEKKLFTACISTSGWKDFARFAVSMSRTKPGEATTNRYLHRDYHAMIALSLLLDDD